MTLLASSLGRRARRRTAVLLGGAVLLGVLGAPGAPASPPPQQKRAAGAKPAQRPSASRRAARRRSTRASARAAPVLGVSAPRSTAAASSAIAAILGSGIGDPGWGVLIVSLTRGDTLFALNADKQFLPASTMKLATTALAFERLGPDHRLSTQVLRDGAVDGDGVLHGNIVIRGGGDPGFSNQWIRGDPGAPMDSLARLVSAAGVRRVTGDVIGDATAFEERRIPEGWLTRYLGAAYAAPVSALSINENVVVVQTRPGAGRGPATVTIAPASGTVGIENSVRTLAGSAGASLSIRRASDGHVVARGWIGSRSAPRYYLLVIDDPARFTTGAFRSALEAQGIAVGGQTRVAPAPAGAVRLTALESPPLWMLAALMNRESINHYAELLFRAAARGRSGETLGSAENGNRALQQFLTRTVGVRAGAVIAADGSGLSTLDRVTPRAQLQMLAYAHRAPWGPAFHASLPVAGESALLRRRMRGTPAQGNLHAKTGTTNDVVGLLGYVTAADGEVIAFSFLYNGSDRWNSKARFDAMGATLAGLARE